MNRNKNFPSNYLISFITNKKKGNIYSNFNGKDKNKYLFYL